jgi:hypothetical protein
MGSCLLSFVTKADKKAAVSIDARGPEKKTAGRIVLPAVLALLCQVVTVSAPQAGRP